MTPIAPPTTPGSWSSSDWQKLGSTVCLFRARAQYDRHQSEWVTYKYFKAWKQLTVGMASGKIDRANEETGRAWLWCESLSYRCFCAKNHDKLRKIPKLFYHGKMLLPMSRTKPPEELTLGSKLSENCPMSRPNFTQYIGNTYIHYHLWYTNQARLQHLQECIYYESIVYVISMWFLFC